MNQSNNNINNNAPQNQGTNQINNQNPNMVNNTPKINNMNPKAPQQNNGVTLNPTPNISVSSTNIGQPQISQVVQTNPSPIENKTTTTNGNQDNSKGGKFKTFLLIVFFIFLLAFIMFLPNISEYLKNGRIRATTDNQINSGTLSCTTDKDNDETTTSYEMDFKFKNKELITSTFNITTESEKEEIINSKYNECKNIEDSAKDLSGIDVSCTTSDNISTMIESYNYRLINTNKLTKFTEAGGTYPEYQYKENIYDIKQKMIKAGYDCKERAY